MSFILSQYELPDWLKTGDYPYACYALGFATEAHRDQVRKYTNEPYIFHCIDVMYRLHKMYGSFDLVCPDTMMAAAALHDTVEDCGVSFQELTETFGKDIAGLVFWLTDVCPKEWGNRATRKRLEAERLKYAPDEAKLIKYCDIASNTESIVEHDPEFAKTYLPEKQRILAWIERATHYQNLVGTISQSFCYKAVV